MAEGAAGARFMSPCWTDGEPGPCPDANARLRDPHSHAIAAHDSMHISDGQLPLAQNEREGHAVMASRRMRADSEAHASSWQGEFSDVDPADAQSRIILQA